MTMPSDRSSPISAFRILTDPAEADEALAAGVCWCGDEYMDREDDWLLPSDSWEDYTYLVQVGWEGEASAAAVVAGSSEAELIATLNKIGKAPEHNPVLDSEFVEFDFIVSARDRERTDALLMALVDAGWLGTDVIASRGVDLDDEPSLAPGTAHDPASAHDTERTNG